MGLRLVTAPVGNPIRLEEAKAHVRRDDEDDDALINGLIAVATSHLDGYAGILGRALLTQTWAMDLDRFPCGAIALPLPPLQEVNSITYYDAADEQQSVDLGTCIVHPGSLGLIEMAPGGSWPATSRRRCAVTVTFVAGYGDLPEGQGLSPVPAGILHAMLLLVGHWYENREAVNIGNIVSELPMAVNALLAPHRVVSF